MQHTNQKEQEKEFIEKVIQIDRISRTVKGGRRIRFRALVVVGNQAGRIGIGVAKAQEVVSAITKAVNIAKKNMLDIEIKNETIPHELRFKQGSAIVFLKPASKGTSIIAGGSVRAVLELAGIKNVVAKILGSSNKINNVQTTFEALKYFKRTKLAEKAKSHQITEKTAKKDKTIKKVVKK